MCRALIPRFYHDKADGKCKEFYYGGCGGNNNNFLTIEDCQNKCRTNEDTVAAKNDVEDKIGSQVENNICNQPKAVGDCRAAFPRWYYNTDSKECEEFVWGGCDGNDNNFASEVKCELRCKNQVSDDARETKSNEIDSNTTPQSISSASKGTKNEICFLPEDGGKCRAIMERYYFNSGTNKCEPFQYGGCGGNDNNFNDKHECEEACVSK